MAKFALDFKFTIKCLSIIFLIGTFVCLKNVMAQENWTLYDVDFSAVNGRPDGGGAWFPQYRYTFDGKTCIPSDISCLPPNDGNNYRTTDPDHRNGYVNGLYLSNDPKIIKLHAYWMRALGIQTVVIDWSNLRIDKTSLTKSPSAAYFDAVVSNTEAIFATYQSMTEFLPPRIVIATRIFASNSSNEISQGSKEDAALILDIVNKLYSQYPTMTARLDNSSAPVSLLFVPFSSSWTNGPQFSDNRFNIRYIDGFLQNVASCNSNSPLFCKINDLPYWSLLENKPSIYFDTDGTYRNVLSYRNNKVEYSSAWVALPRWGNNLLWDNVWTSVVAGLHTFERQLSPFYGNPPKVLMVGRFNNMNGVYSQPQEGVNAESAQMLEPSQDRKFTIFDMVRKNLANFRGHNKSSPGVIGINYLSGQFGVSWAEYPTEYQVTDSISNNETWNFVESTSTKITIPFNYTSTFIRSRNSFGTTPWLKFWPRFVPPNTVVKLRSGLSNKCLDVTNASSLNGTKIQQWDCNGSLQQAWTIEPSGNFFHLRNNLTGKLLDIADASLANGAKLQQWSANGSWQQDFIIMQGVNSLYIINRLSGKSLDVVDQSYVNGSAIQQWDLNGQLQQSWIIEPI